MKAYIALGLLASVLVVVSAKSCTEQEDCADGQCCAGFMPFRGTCRSLSKKGAKCLVDEPTFPFNDIHIMACPCAEGLECVAKEGGKKKKNDGKCQKPEETTVAPTTTESSVEETEQPEEQTTRDDSQEPEATQEPHPDATQEPEPEPQPEEQVSEEPAAEE